MIAVLVLSGCTLFNPKPVVPDVPALPPQKQTVNIPPGLIADCTPMTKPDPTKSYSQGESVDVIDVWIDEYKDCAGRFKRYVGLTAPVLNINEVQGMPLYPDAASAPAPASAPQ